MLHEQAVPWSQSMNRINELEGQLDALRLGKRRVL
jgi:hypothetical protein